MAGPVMWNDKRYHSLDYHMKTTFGEKVYKIALDAGMTCPNRDGLLDTRGCIFCSSGGSGDFAAPASDSVTNQIDKAVLGIKASKARGGSMKFNRFIAYFQSYTNTYGPLEYLERIFTEAASHPDVCALSIGTRPDCLPDKVLDLLSRLNQVKPVWVELGLQTIHEKTADFIRRGYPLSVFHKAVKDLRSRNIDVIVHTIVGLPFETRANLKETICHVGSLPIQGIKLQLLHVLKGTDLADYLDRLHILSLEEYIDLVVMCLEELPPDIVVHRITGDGPRDLLLAPMWSTKKKHVMNEINRTLKERNTWQGRKVSL